MRIPAPPQPPPTPQCTSTTPTPSTLTSSATPSPPRLTYTDIFFKPPDFLAHETTLPRIHMTLCPKNVFIQWSDQDWNIPLHHLTLTLYLIYIYFLYCDFKWLTYFTFSQFTFTFYFVTLSSWPISLADLSQLLTYFTCWLKIGAKFNAPSCAVVGSSILCFEILFGFSFVSLEAVGRNSIHPGGWPAQAAGCKSKIIQAGVWRKYI